MRSRELPIITELQMEGFATRSFATSWKMASQSKIYCDLAISSQCMYLCQLEVIVVSDL